MTSENQTLPIEINKKLNLIKKQFCYPINTGLNIRNIYIKCLNKPGILVSLEGMVDTKILERQIIEPLIKMVPDNPLNDVLLMLETQILSIKKIERITTLSLVVENILNGNTILLLDGTYVALSLSTIGFEHRAVEKPTTENVLKGPKEAFVESAQINLSLIRRQLRTDKLIAEKVQVGSNEISTVYMTYIDDVVNKKILDSVRSRLLEIKSEYVQNLSILEQHIEERPYSLVPSVLYTERPDRVSSLLHEGHIALIMDNSPSCLVVPITFWTLFHTGEDHYERWSYGNFIRIVRFMAFLIAFLTPALYIAVTNYHQEMIPTDLVLAIAGTRETLPLPAVLEVLLMEVAFELIREAGTRIPTTIGPTIGIVGALILGQAAVEANVVSPILVIVVAMTGLSSFAIPEISFNYMVRIGRFILVLCSAILGFYGFATFIALVGVYFTSIKSFEVPFLSPMAPHYPSSKDTLLRPPTWKQWLRPLFLKPQDKVRKKKPGE